MRNKQQGGAVSFGSNVCCFDGFTWTIDYSFSYNDNNAKGIHLAINNTSISIANNRWQKDGQQFSPEDLGFTSWPEETSRGSLRGTITVYYKSSPVKTYNNTQIVNSITLGSFDQWKEGGKVGPYAHIGSVEIKLSDFNVGDLSVIFTVIGDGVNGNAAISKAYQAKTNKKKASNTN